MKRLEMNLFNMLIFSMLILFSCSDGTGSGESGEVYNRLQGQTMGTTYSVTYKGDVPSLQKAVDSLLVEVNNAVSTYVSDSDISRFNQEGKITTSNQHFIANVEQAYIAYIASAGAFDPTVAPLVNAWGFGWEGKKPEGPAEERLAELLSLVGYDKIEVDRQGESLTVYATVPGMQLDFSALAKGYGVDQVCELLESNGTTDYFVEIGGEVRVSGSSPRGDAWITGISHPSAGSNPADFYTRIQLTGAALATSGNYRNFYEVDGRKVWHTIDPRTGNPMENPTLSASIVAPQCIDADALATACMVMGSDRCIEMVQKVQAEAYVLVSNGDGEIRAVMSPGFDKYLKQ